MTAGPAVIELAEAGSLLLELGADLYGGRVTDAVVAARRLAGILVAMVPPDQLKAFLRPEDRVMADLVADVAEAVKLDALPDSLEEDKLRAKSR